MTETGDELIYECNNDKYKDIYITKNDSMNIEKLNFYRGYRVDMFGDTIKGTLYLNGGGENYYVTKFIN